MEIENARVLAREEAATAKIMDPEIAAEIVGSDEADVPVPIASTNKPGRKTRYVKFVDSHTHVCFFIECSYIVYIYVHLRRKPKARGGDPRPKRSKRKSTV
jgi:hypothetical protein